MVYSLLSNSWRRIIASPTPSVTSYDLDAHQVFVKRAVHWKAFLSVGRWMILAFDFNKEVF